jgi:hypothetical protein
VVEVVEEVESLLHHLVGLVVVVVQMVVHQEFLLPKVQVTHQAHLLVKEMMVVMVLDNLRMDLEVEVEVQEV